MFRVPRRWIVCASCSLVYAISGINNYCYYGIVLAMSLIYRELPSSVGCPFLYSESQWYTHQELPFSLPHFLWVTWQFYVSIYAIGRTVTGVPAGMASDIGYAKYVLCGGLLLQGLNYIIMPLCGDHVTAGVIHILIDGVSDGCILPSIVALISRWAKPSERNIFFACVLSGFAFGNIIGYAFFKLAYVETKSFKIGKVLTGTLHLACLPLVWTLIRHSPFETSTAYLQEDSRSHLRRQVAVTVKRLYNIPWCSIVRSGQFIMLILVYMSIFYVSNVNISVNFKFYQKYILHLPSVISQRPMVADMTIIPAFLIGGYLSDWFVKMDILTKPTLKKAITCFSVLASSFLMVSANLVGCEVVRFWVLIISSTYILNFAAPAICSTFIDLSPQNAGLFMGIAAGTSQIVLLFVYQLHSIILNGFYIYVWKQWLIKTVFFSIVSCAMTLPFLIFGSVEELRWPRPNPVYNRLVLQNVEYSEQTRHNNPVVSPENVTAGGSSLEKSLAQI